MSAGVAYPAAATASATSSGVANGVFSNTLSTMPLTASGSASLPGAP